LKLASTGFYSFEALILLPRKGSEEQDPCFLVQELSRLGDTKITSKVVAYPLPNVLQLVETQIGCVIHVKEHCQHP